MTCTIEPADTADESIRATLVRALFSYNVQQTGISDFRPLGFALRDTRGDVVGGLWGRTVYGWLFVELLFVPESMRGQGIGTQLLERAETEARLRGCGHVWLDTFEFQARGFYERLGYRCFGELADYPPGYSRYFMKKAL